MVADSPESRRSFFGAPPFLLRTGAERKDRRGENGACGEGVDEVASAPQITQIITDYIFIDRMSKN